MCVRVYKQPWRFNSPYVDLPATSKDLYNRKITDLERQNNLEVI